MILLDLEQHCAIERKKQNDTCHAAEQHKLK